MPTQSIHSLQHPLVKYGRDLRLSRKARKESQQVVIAGIKQVSEIAPLEVLFALDEYPLPLPKAKKTYLVSSEILKKVTGLVSPEPLAAIVPMPLEDPLKNKKWILVLDGIQDPGNLGTLLRTALALGWEGVFLTNDSVDLFNEKALRSAKGATFNIPFRRGTSEELAAFLDEEERTILVADKEGRPLHKTTPKTPLVLILGNEAHGPSLSFKNRYPMVAIPIQEMESLNVAVAGAILMYTLSPEIYS